MSSYGDYQIIKEIGWSHGATLYSAKKGNEENYVVKVFSLAFFGFAGDDDDKAKNFADLFNSRIENQKKAANHSARFAPIFQEGYDTDSAWYVTRLYSNSVQKLIESHSQLRREEFFQLITAIVNATVEFKKVCGRSHGNVKATNVFLNKPGKTGLGEVVLGDAAPGDASKAGNCELADLRGIGEIIHRLVINENREEEYWKLPPPPSLQEWVGIFGKDAEAWRSLCARLLEPDLTIQHYNLEELAFDVARLKPESKLSKQVLAIAAVVVVAMVVGIFAVKHFAGAQADKTEAELREKKAQDQALRLAKEKRAAEERAEVETQARLAAQKNAEEAAKRLADEKRAAERAILEAKAQEEIQRKKAQEDVKIKAEALEQLGREAARKAAESERLVKEANAKRAAAEAELKGSSPVAASSSAQKQPKLGVAWSNSLGMRFVPVPGSKALFCAWETRRKDFDQFVKLSTYHASTAWKATTFKQEDSEPVVNVDGLDATLFCQWLTETERRQGLISPKQSYRLPSDREWSLAAGVESAAGTKVFAWGSALPAPVGVGNLAPWCGYDRFAFTAPVAQFRANEFGLYDLVGNAWEICADGSGYVARGASWQTELPDQLNVLFRLPVAAGDRKQDVGFRCVLDLGAN